MASKDRRRPSKSFVLTTGQENFRGLKTDVESSNFAFRQRTLGLDWRKVAGIDCDEIRESGNVELLQDLIFTITFCNVDAEFAHSPVIDKNLLKLFKTSQLIIEYLIHCQECLLTTVSKNSQELILLREETARLQEKLDSERELVKKLKKECHKRRQIAAQYQSELMALKSGSIPRQQFPCPDCPKIFLSHYYLKLHMAKRHDHEMPKEGAVPEKPGQLDFSRPVTKSPDMLHKQEMEELRSYFSRELTEMSEKMGEWQRLAEQLRVQREVSVQNRSSSPTPAPVLQPPVESTKQQQSNFGTRLEDDVADQEKRIMDNLGGQLNNQFVAFANQVDERVLQLSRGMADQLAADSRRNVEVLTEQVSTLMAQLAREREARQAAERQRDDALVAKQQVTYIQPRSPQKGEKRPVFRKGKESRSTPSLAMTSTQLSTALPVAPQPPPVSETPPVSTTPAKAKKKSFIEALTCKFKSPKKATSTPSLVQQPEQAPQQPQQQQYQQPQYSSATLPKPTPAASDYLQPTLPKLPSQQSPQKRQSSQPFLVALMEDGGVKDSESELTSRPSSSSPQHPSSSANDALSPRTKWSNAEPVPVITEEPRTQPLPVNLSDTLQASMTLPTMSATGLSSTGPSASVGKDTGLLATTEVASTSASGLAMKQHLSADVLDESITVTTTEIDGAVRRQMMDLVDRELEKRGIAKGARRLDADRFAALRVQLEEERRKREFTHPDFYSNTRNQILSTIDKMARERMAGGSTYRSEMTESSFQQPPIPVIPDVPSRIIRPPSTDATPRADKSEILPTDSQWTSDEDTSEMKGPSVITKQSSNMPITVVPASVAASSSTAVAIGSAPASGSLTRKNEPPAVLHFSDSEKRSPKVAARKKKAGQQQHLAIPSRHEGVSSPSGTTDDVSTLDVTSSIRDHPVGGNNTHDFDETDSDEQMKREMIRYNIEPRAAEATSTTAVRKPATQPSSSMPVFGKSSQSIGFSGSRPPSSLTGISDDYDPDSSP